MQQLAHRVSRLAGNRALVCLASTASHMLIHVTPLQKLFAKWHADMQIMIIIIIASINIIPHKFKSLPLTSEIALMQKKKKKVQLGHLLVCFIAHVITIPTLTFIFPAQLYLLILNSVSNSLGVHLNEKIN